MLQKYEIKYKLLSRSDIIRMLLSEVDWLSPQDLEQKSKKQFSSFIKGLAKPESNFSEDEILDYSDSSNT